MNALSQLREDAFYRLRGEETLGDVLILDMRPRGEGEAAQIISTIEQALAGMQAGPTGKSGLAIVVLPPDGEVPEPDKPGPVLDLILTIRIYENVMVNGGANGTGMEGEVCALEVLRILHLMNCGGRTLYAHKRAIREVTNEEENMGGYAWDVVLSLPASAGKQTRTAAPRITVGVGGLVTLDGVEDGAAIYSTTDGSAPAQSNAAASLYEAAFVAASGSTIRAAAFVAGKLGSHISQKDAP